MKVYISKFTDGYCANAQMHKVDNIENAYKKAHVSGDNTGRVKKEKKHILNKVYGGNGKRVEIVF